MLKSKSIAMLTTETGGSMNQEINRKIQAGIEIMRADGASDLAIEQFVRVYKLALAGDTGYIEEKDIQALIDVPQYEQLPKHEYWSRGLQYLSKVEIIKLNGGLGTNMGLDVAKTLLPVKIENNFIYGQVVKENINFLDFIFRQVALDNVNLALMSSSRTKEGTLSYHQAKYYNLPVTTFIQNRVPKINANTMEPVDIAKYEDEGFNPPGHGEIYSVLTDQKLIDKWLAEGKEYLFISNGDNLSATLDPIILNYVVQKEIPFLMEVAERTPNDTKGGHLVNIKSAAGDWRLALRESAQVNPKDIDPQTDKTYGEDIHRHKYFNTNSIWINLRALKAVLVEYNNILPLALIRNGKTLNDGTKVYQLETAMGSAISVFKGAEAIVVPKRRFAPVKNCNDLLLYWSDIYEIYNKKFHLTINPHMNGRPLPIVILDDKYYKKYEDFKARIDIANPPSLLDCVRLEVKGDVRFGPGVRIVGEVIIDNTGESATPLVIENKTIKGQSGYKFVANNRDELMEEECL
jgi:UDP-N-acetylglucosamine pyrophosphorylase